MISFVWLWREKANKNNLNGKEPEKVSPYVSKSVSRILGNNSNEHTITGTLIQFDTRNSFIGGAAHSPVRKMTLTGLETSLDMAFTLQGTSKERCI